MVVLCCSFGDVGFSAPGLDPINVALFCAALEVDKVETSDGARETLEIGFLRGKVWATGLKVTAADRATTALKSLLGVAGSGAAPEVGWLTADVVAVELYVLGFGFCVWEAVGKARDWTENERHFLGCCPFPLPAEV